MLACLGKITNDGENFAKNVYKKLVTKIDVVDNKIPNTNWLISKRQYNSEKQRLEKYYCR